jgi:hypothetical protein
MWNICIWFQIVQSNYYVFAKLIHKENKRKFLSRGQIICPYSRKANPWMASLVNPRVTWFYFENVDILLGHEHCRTKTSFIYTVEIIETSYIVFSNNYFHDLFIRFVLKRQIIINFLMIYRVTPRWNVTIALK